MTGYADIHCHIIPGVDDGAHDTEEALDMLRIMHDEGIRDVIATPHYHGGRMETGIEKVKERFEKLCAAKDSDGELSDMNLYLGCEIYYYPSVIEWLEEGRVSSLAGSGYVLLEFGFTMDKRMIFEGVSAVMNAGYLPVVAHVERYEKLLSDIGNVRELISRGAYIQINSEAFYARHKVKSFVKKLLKNEMVHFLATDAHDTWHRGPYLADAARYVSKHYGEDYCQRLLCTNPAAVINNGYIPLR